MRPVIALLLLLSAASAHAQAFVATIDDDIGVILGSPAVVRLATGETVVGRLLGATLVNGYLSAFSFRPDSGGAKVKYRAEDVDRIAVKASRAARFVMRSESQTSMLEMMRSDFEKAAVRDSVIYETARRANRRGTVRLMQLLNPGFDSLVKVFADPNAKKTLGLSISGVRLAGGEDKSFLFVQGGERTVLVKKGSYEEDFATLFASCPTMVQEFSGEKLRWVDVAAHVFVYDRRCR